MDSQHLAYTGKIIAIDNIPGADFIACATVVCGQGGRWKGVVRKADYHVGMLVTVFLPDAVIPKSDDMKFMEKSGWRVKMQRFKGAPSEVVIVPLKVPSEVGEDCTQALGVTKYYKTVPSDLHGVAKGPFPSFVPKTDEPNYQSVPEMVEALVGHSFVVTEKVDGSSTTAYRYQEQFGVCNRNLELERDEDNGYWKVALQYRLDEKLPEGYALQWETCGPGIQKNPMGFREVAGLAFSAYDIEKRMYLTFIEFHRLCDTIGFPMVKALKMEEHFCKENIETMGEGCYASGKPREGVVVRSIENHFGHKPISFKIMNLSYDH